MTFQLGAALRPVLSFLKRRNVAYRIGGSLASSSHGIARATMDVDIVADLDEPDLLSLARELEASYYLPVELARQAVRLRSSFNLIDQRSMVKIDMFVFDGTAFERSALDRAREQDLAPGGATSLVARVTTPEDTILVKLRWYRQGGEVSENQWRDVIGVLQVQGSGLDRRYLRNWATDLGVLDLLERAMDEAG